MADSYLDWSPYNYVGGNPIKRTDTDGAYWDLVIEAASIAAGVTSMIDNISNGNGWAATADGVGVVVDVVLAVVPCVPGGTGLAIQSYRAGDKAIDAMKTVDAAKDVSKTVENSTDVAKATEKVTDGIKTSEKANFVVTPDGTAVSTDLNKVQKSYDNAGFQKIETNETNVVYEVPKSDGNGTFYSRLQQGKKPRQTNVDGDRVINTQNTGNTRNKEYVNPDGSRIEGPVPKEQRKATGHIHLEPKL